MIIRISTRNDFFYIEKRAFKIFNFEWWVPYKDYMFGYIFAVIGTVSTITLSDSNRTYIINNYSDLANEELLNNNITKLPILNFTNNTEDIIQFNTISKLNLSSVTNFKIYSKICIWLVF